MSKTEVAQRSPYVLEMEAGTYWWCRCGRSGTQPFCDGSHKDTGFAPVRLDLEEPKRIAFCGCKQTKNSPFCDGSHKKLA